MSSADTSSNIKATAGGAPPTGYLFEDLAPGMTASLTKTVTEADIVEFAEISGDNNPLHLDPAYGASTMFKSRIAHGMLTASYISAVVGTRLPGVGCVYVSQMLKFKAPVRIGDVVTARAEVTSLVPEKKFAVLKTQCFVGEKLVVDGEATTMVPSRSTG